MSSGSSSLMAIAVIIAMCSCRASLVRSAVSQRRLDDSVYVLPKRSGIDMGEARPPMQQLFGAEALTRERAEFGDRTSVTGDGQVLARSDSIEHLAGLVLQLANRHFGHGRDCAIRARMTFGTTA